MQKEKKRNWALKNIHCFYYKVLIFRRFNVGLIYYCIIQQGYFHSRPIYKWTDLHPETKKEYKKNNASPPTSCWAFHLFTEPFATLGWFIFNFSKSQKSSNRMLLLVSCYEALENSKIHMNNQKISKWILILRNPRCNNGSHSCLEVWLLRYMNNLCQSQNAYVHDNSLVTSIATSIWKQYIEGGN